MNSLTAGNVQLSLPYVESLNSLVNYDSELSYSSNSSIPNQSQGTAPLDISRKLPTKLSKKPSTYEKKLRQLVIDLYSDNKIFKGKLEQSTDMSSSAELPVVQVPVTPVVQEAALPVVQGPVDPVIEDSGLPVVQGLELPVVQGPRVPVVEGPPLEGASHWGVQRVSAPQPLDMIRMTEPCQSLSESESEGYCSQGNSVASAEESRIQSLQELQGYLAKYQSSKQELSSRNLSFSSDLTTPLFDDSGIHLEFALPFDNDISEEEGNENNTYADSCQGTEHHKPQQSCRRVYRQPSFFVGEGEKSEAADVLDPDSVHQFSGQQNFLVSQRHEAKENVLNKNLTTGSGQIRTSDLASTKDVLRGQTIIGSHDQDLSSPVQNLEAEANVFAYKNMPPRHSRAKKAELATAEEVTRVQVPFTGQEISLTPSSVDDARVFSLENMLSQNDHEKRVNLVGTEGALVVHKNFSRETCQDLELQRASLEGKLESLQEEFGNVLEDRKSLQIRLQAVEVRLKEELQKAQETKPTVVSLVDELRQNKSDLESQLVKLQSVYEEKRDGLSEALERLKTASVTIQKLKHKVSLLEGEICQREETVSALQTEMDSLRKLLDQAKDQNEQFKKENTALNADIVSLVEAKEWLQKQLKVAGEARMKMQLEASELESALAAKNQLIEQLRCDGARSVQQLTEMQQNALMEKAQILKQMEQVEDDISQQNLVFKELEVDKQRMERTLGERVESLTNENKKLLKLMSSAVEIKKELDAAKQDVVLKEALLDTIVKEKDEIKEQLKLARESTEEYKRHLSELETKFSETKQELKVVQDDIGEKESYIEKLHEEKRILQENLEVANEERAACDNAIQTLRLDLEKVDRRFKLMKRELTAKTSQLEETTRQKDGFVGELRALREGFENQVSLSRAVKEELVQKEKLIEEFKGVKDALEKEIDSLTRQLEYSQDEIARMDKERNQIQEQLQSAVRDIVHLEEKFHQSLLERARLEGELETTQNSNRDETESLRHQNASLREEHKTEKLLLQTEVTKERDKVINLEQELKLVADDMNKKESQYNQELQVMKESLEDMKSRKEIAEHELRKLHELTEQSVDELKRTYESQVKGLQDELAALQHEKVRLDKEYVAFQKKTSNELGIKSREMSQMEKELSFLNGMLKQMKAEAEKMQLCAIELEREKGRLAGVLASQKTLREHVVKMENEIATRESTLLEMSNEMESLKKEEEKQRKTASERMRMLETQLNNLRQENKNLQESFRKERKDNASLRSEVEEKANERVDLMKKIGAVEKEVKQLQEKVRNESNEVKRYRSQLETVKSSLVEQQAERENLQRNLKAVLEQEAAKDNRVQSLEWDVSRRTKEVEYLKEQLRIMEERQQLELENLKTALQVSRSETTSLRSDLSEARKTKCAYQTKTFDLKDSLLTARQITESLKQELFVKRQELKALVEDVLAARNLQHLQEEVTKRREATADCEESRDDTDAATRVPTSCLRPISGLQECMSSLRSQISNLQKQMNDHTDSVLTASTSWRSFKENVHQLQASCSSQNSQLLTAEKDNY